jgi:hypothetical protein
VREVSPRDVELRRKAKALVRQLRDAVVGKAFQLGLKTRVKEYDSEATINIEDVNPDRPYADYAVIAKATYHEWSYRPKGEVVIKTLEPKPGRQYSRKTVCRKALTKTGELNVAAVWKWMEEVAATKVRLAQYAVEAKAEEKQAAQRLKESEAIRAREIVGVVPSGVAVSRNMDDGSYRLRLDEDFGLTAAEVNAILGALLSRKNS